MARFFRGERRELDHICKELGAGAAVGDLLFFPVVTRGSPSGIDPIRVAYRIGGVELQTAFVASRVRRINPELPLVAFRWKERDTHRIEFQSRCLHNIKRCAEGGP